MPHIPNTPESLIQRTDSKNPATTCHGLTNDGKRCRRSLASAQTSPSSMRKRNKTKKSNKLNSENSENFGNDNNGDGSEDSDKDEEDEIDISIYKDNYYCWQHRDQQELNVTSPQTPHSGLTSSSGQKQRQKQQQKQQQQQQQQKHRHGQRRESLDTLVDRLGILEVETPVRNNHNSVSYTNGNERPSHQAKLKTKPSQVSSSVHRRQNEKQNSKRSSLFLCCFGLPKEFHKKQKSRPTSRPVKKISEPSSLTGEKFSSSSKLPKKVHHDQPQPYVSRTEEFLSLIPPTTSPETASQLLSILAKPVSEKDAEGFIYMFWLTSESLPGQPPLEVEAASLLLSPEDSPKTTDFLDKFSKLSHSTSRSIPTSSTSHKKILLKIGRAQNVHRRLNQWTRQCGYNLSLIRYYPYQPSSSKQLPTKVPNANKVERLIHVEIGSKRVSIGRCEACGKEHKEWFEIDASRDGVKEIDEIIRRWVDWNLKDNRKVN